MTIEFIDITPDRSLMLKLGNSGYSLDESLSELVDNSLDAKLQTETLRIEIEIGKDKIIVKDNAKGMSKEEITSALKLGASKKENQLGKFGLGMKTSCLSLGEKFCIETSQGTEEIFILEYDQEKWLKEGDWQNFPLKKIEKQTGTKITVTDLIVEIDDKKIEKLKQHLGTRFGLFIKHNLAKIFVNGELCSAYIPELLSEGKKDFELELLNGNKVKGWFGFQVAGSQKSDFGFHTYRNNRLITFYDKVGISKNQKAKQIIGEVHINHIPVTHNKRGWIKESPEYKTFEKEFSEFLRDFDQKLRKLVTGLSACPGRVEGTARFLDSFELGEGRQEKFEKLEEGDIIVTQMTRPDMVFHLQKAKAIVADLGGTLSHAGIVAREFGIPCIVGTENATKVLRDGQKVIVDATEGVVYDGE